MGLHTKGFLEKLFILENTTVAVIQVNQTTRGLRLICVTAFIFPAPVLLQQQQFL